MGNGQFAFNVSSVDGLFLEGFATDFTKFLHDIICFNSLKVTIVADFAKFRSLDVDAISFAVNTTLIGNRSLSTDGAARFRTAIKDGLRQVQIPQILS